MKKLALASFWVFTSLLAMLFALGMALIFQLHMSAAWTAACSGGFALLIVGLQYTLGPVLIDWIVQTVWCDPRSVDDEFARWYSSTCRTFGIPEPRFGIIEDGAPNAFTYGHGAYDARVVITRGVIDMLSRQELRAVVAHELGHVKHRDFIVMTVVQGLVLALYALYIGARYSSHRGSFFIAFVSWLAYHLSYYISLYLSRVREYMADYASAQIMSTGNHLSLALVKICYGLAQSRPALTPATAPSYGQSANGYNTPFTQSSPVAFSSQAQGFDPADALVSAHGQALGRLGIGGRGGADGPRFSMEPKSFGAFGIASTAATRTAIAWTGVGGGPNPMNFTRAARWELYNPWSRIAEFLSTHPMTVRRIQALQKLNRLWNVKNVFDFSKIQPGRYDGFLGDLGALALPWLGAIAGAVSFGLRMDSYIGVVGGSCTGLGVGLLLRALFMYRGGERPATVLDCVGEIEVSHVRPIPVVINGTITGRVDPGVFWASDFILQDDTGFVTCVIRMPFGLDWLWGWIQGSTFIGQPATIHGWYRRFTAPFVEVDHFTTAYSGTHYTYAKLCALAHGLFVIAIGLMALAYLH